MFGRSPTESNPGDPYTKPIGRVRTVQAILPRGLIGNPEAGRSAGERLPGVGKEGLQAAGCPADTQIGELRVMFSDGFGGGGWGTSRNCRRSRSTTSAAERSRRRLRLQGGRPLHRPHLPDARPRARLRDQTTAPYITDIIVRGVQLTIWGVPGDPRTSIPLRAPSRGRTADEEEEEFDEEDESDFGAPVGPPVQAAAQPADGLRRQQRAVPVHRRLLGPPRDIHPAAAGRQPTSTSPAATTRGSASIRRSTCSRPTGPPAHRPASTSTSKSTAQPDRRKPEELYPANGQLHGVDTPPMKKVVTTFPKE